MSISFCWITNKLLEPSYLAINTRMLGPDHPSFQSRGTAQGFWLHCSKQWTNLLPLLWFSSSAADVSLSAAHRPWKLITKGGCSLWKGLSLAAGGYHCIFNAAFLHLYWSKTRSREVASSSWVRPRTTPTQWYLLQKAGDIQILPGLLCLTYL